MPPRKKTFQAGLLWRKPAGIQPRIKAYRSGYDLSFLLCEDLCDLCAKPKILNTETTEQRQKGNGEKIATNDTNNNEKHLPPRPSATPPIHEGSFISPRKTRTDAKNSYTPAKPPKLRLLELALKPYVKHQITQSGRWACPRSRSARQILPQRELYPPPAATLHHESDHENSK